MSDFSDWFRTVPFFTRYWLALTVGFTLIGRFGIVHPGYLTLMYAPLAKFQIWRLFTSVLYYPLSPATGFHYLINLYFLHTYSKRLENEVYAGKPADYFYMLLFNWLACIVLGLLLNVSLLMDPMVLSVLYIWCQLNKDVTVTFWFGTQFKAIYLPWVLLAFNMIINGGGLVELMGIIIGHLYFFMKFKFPQELGGPVLLETPSIIKEWFPSNSGGIYGFGVPPERPAQAAPNGGSRLGRHIWGRGQVLGNN